MKTQNLIEILRASAQNDNFSVRVAESALDSAVFLDSAICANLPRFC